MPRPKEAKPEKPTVVTDADMISGKVPVYDPEEIESDLMLEWLEEDDLPDPDEPDAFLGPPRTPEERAALLRNYDWRKDPDELRAAEALRKLGLPVPD